MSGSGPGAHDVNASSRRPCAEGHPSAVDRHPNARHLAWLDHGGVALAFNIAVSYRGDPLAPATWSGTPRGLSCALEDLGLNVTTVSAELPRALRFAVRAAAGSFHSAWLPERPSVELQSMKARLALGRSRELHGLVQMGYDYELPHVDNLVTYDDMTIQQGFALGDPWFVRPPSTMRAWLARQRAAFDRAAACCVGSRWVADALVREGAAPAGKVRIVGFGRNLDPRPLERDWYSPRFLFIGREWGRKNGPAVVDAFLRLRRELPEVRLDVVGGHPPLGLEGVVEHGLLRLGVSEHRQRLEQLFESATCFVMPSRYEPFGIAYAEAAAAGVPSIGTSVGGAKQIIGDAGWLVAPDDPAALLAAMREAADGATAAALGHRANERATLFTWSSVAERVTRALGLALDRELTPDLEDVV